MLPRLLAWFVALVLLGWLLPGLIGASPFDVQLMFAYAAMSIFFLSPLVCETVFTDPSPRNIGIGAAFGFLSALLLIAIRILAANRQLRPERFLVPDTPTLLSLLLVSFAFPVFGAAAAALVTLHSTSIRSAKQKMRSGFLLLLLGAVLLAKYGNGEWRDQLALLFTADRMPTFALRLSGVLLALAALIYLRIRRQPRYSSAFHFR